MKKLTKFRASGVGNITLLDRATQLTLIQSKKLTQLQEKETLTEAQCNEYDKLIAKRDAPPALSKGAKTHVENVFFGEKFNYQKRFTNKFTQKGNDKEVAAIHEVVKYLGLPMVTKNEQHFENDFVKGTPDMILKSLDMQIDIKNCYYPSGLNTFDTKVEHIYKEQGHSYNWLTSTSTSFVCKILLNPPENLLEKEAYLLMKEAGLSKMTDSFFKEVRDLFNFEAMPIEDRIKLFKIETNEYDIDRLKTSVILANEHLEHLNELWQQKNKEEILFINQQLKM